MPTRALRLGVAFAVLGAAPTPGQDVAARIGASLAATARPFDPATTTGAGVDWLVAVAGDAHAVLVGESHGNRQTLALCERLLRDLADRGFGGYAIENGPVTTDHLEHLLRDGGVEAAQEWLRRQPFSMAFLNWREEIAHADVAVRDGYDLIGIDQEFVGCARFLLGELAELAPDDDARRLATGWVEREQAAFAHYGKTGDPSRGFLAAAGPDDHAALARAFTAEPAATIVAELRATAHVYGLHHRGEHFANNRERARLMKAHLRRAGDATARRDRPRLLVRLGSMHAGRGHSPLLQLDVGNHLAELAARDDGDTLHVYVWACRSRDADGERDLTATAPGYAPLYDAMPDEGAVVFDLRPARATFTSAAAQQALPELFDLVRRYDVAVVFPTFDRCTDLVPVPRRGR